MRTRKRSPLADVPPSFEPDVEVVRDMVQVKTWIQHAMDRYMEGRLGGARENLEVAERFIENLKAKMVRMTYP